MKLSPLSPTGILPSLSLNIRYSNPPTPAISRQPTPFLALSRLFVTSRDLHFVLDVLKSLSSLVMSRAGVTLGHVTPHSGFQVDPSLVFNHHRGKIRTSRRQNVTKVTFNMSEGNVNLVPCLSTYLPGYYYCDTAFPLTHKLYSCPQITT